MNWGAPFCLQKASISLRGRSRVATAPLLRGPTFGGLCEGLRESGSGGVSCILSRTAEGSWDGFSDD